MSEWWWVSEWWVVVVVVVVVGVGGGWVGELGGVSEWMSGSEDAMRRSMD